MYNQEFLQMLDRTAWPPDQHQWMDRPPPSFYEKETLGQDHVGDPCADGQPGNRAERAGEWMQ